MRNEALASFVLLASLSGLASAEFTQNAVYLISSAPNFSIVNITEVTFTPGAIYVGGSADVATTLYNNGTVQSSVTVAVEIYDSVPQRVDAFNYSPAIISPNTNLVLVKAWSAGALPAGAYCAHVAAHYGDGFNMSNTYVKCFTIINLPVTPPAPSGSSGGYVTGVPPSENATPQAPTTLPDVIKPVYKDIRFLRSTVLSEVLAGTSAFESFTIKNDAEQDRNVRIIVTGAGESWISFQPAETLMKPHEERVINLGLTVPTYATPGDYLLKIQVGEKEFSTEYMVVRVKDYPPSYPYPVLLRSVRLDRLSRDTIVALHVRNLGGAPIPVVEIRDELPEGIIARPEDIRFLDKPGEVAKGQPLRLSWKFLQLAPNEIGYATYSVPIVLEEYSQYVYWAGTQIEVPERETTVTDLIDIKQIFAPELEEGRFGEVYVDVFYGGIAQSDVRALLEAPLDFSVEPRNAFETLTPRALTRIRFTVRPPKGSAGTHLVNFRIISSAGILSKSASLHVRGREQIEAAGLLNLVPLPIVLFGAAALVAAAAVYYSSKARKARAREALRYRSGRDTYLGEIKELMEK
ncbi:MAG: hypothetical protein V1787_02985 [Candidatus Micrarchaeota archaeon]